MKYIEQYIKRNYPNANITKSVESNSKYVDVNGFYIRISDHLSPLLKHCVGTCHLEIIQPFGEKDNFIIIHTPTMRTLTKKRKDVNSFVRNIIELHNLEKNTNVKIKVKKSTQNLLEYINTLTTHLHWSEFSSHLGRVDCWRYLTQNQKKKFSILYDFNDKFITKDFFNELTNIPIKKQYTNNEIGNYVLNIINKYKLKKVV